QRAFAEYQRSQRDPIRSISEWKPRFGCYPCSQLRLRIKPLRDVGTRLVHDDCNIVSLSDQLAVAARNDLAGVLFRLNHEQNLIHESSHSPRGTRLLQRGHIKNDVVEVAGF